MRHIRQLTLPLLRHCALRLRYAGTVTYFDPENMLHKVDYDDGETYRHDLSEAGWRVVGSPLPRVPAARRSTGGNGGVAKSQAET